MNTKLIRHWPAFFCFALAMLVMLSMSNFKVYADDFKLTLISVQNNQYYSGVNWNVYKIGEKNAGGEFVLTGDFAHYPVSLDSADTTSAMQEIANTLASCTVTDSLASIASGFSDDNGNAVLSVAEKGIYLVTGEEYLSDTQKVVPSPMIIEIKQSDIEAGEISVYTKFEVVPVPVDDEQFSVKKLWVIPEGVNVKPTSVLVEIHMDGEIFETVTLNEENSWRYTWEYEANHTWDVKEINIPENFTVVYSKNATAFSIENTYKTTGGSDDSSSKSETSSQTSTGTKDKIPQTGMLWWPVPILSGFGIIMVAVGFRLNKKRK